jgi:hypothetical protein
MGRVTLHFSEEDYQLFRHYCGNYCRLSDETRKNSVKILLELYKHQVIDIQEHSLDNIFTFFYRKKQEFESEGKSPGSNPEAMMRVRVCTDILSFLEDLEKIYRLLRKKNVEANYILIIGSFSKIFDEENQTRMEDLNEAASAAIDAIVSPLGAAIAKRRGSTVDSQDLLYELVSFTETFNRLSPGVTFNDDVIGLIAPSLMKKFGLEVNYDELRTLLQDHRDQFELDELESALEGGIHAQNVWGHEFPWESFLEPLRTLNEMIAQNQSLMLVSLDVLSALEAPMKDIPAPSEYTQLALYQKPYGMVRRRNDENRILVTVDNRSRSEIQTSSFSDITPQVYSAEQKYKQYFSLTAGAMVLLIIIFASVILTVAYAPAFTVGNTSKEILGNKSVAVAGVPANVSTPLKVSIPPPTLLPTPIPTRQYVTIEQLVQDPDTGPKSSKGLFENPAVPPNIDYDSSDYVTIFKNNISYNGENSYRVSFDMRNPPMVIRFNVSPQTITDKKWFEPHDYQKKIDTAVLTRPDEFAWFEIKIYENDTLDDTTGWGGLYGIPSTKQEVVLRNPGMYQLEFSGHLVTVASEVLVKKAGNIKA